MNDDDDKHEFKAYKLTDPLPAEISGLGGGDDWPEWQPIATAPKDGCNVLLLDDGEAVVGRWADWANGWVANRELQGYIWLAPNFWLPIPPKPLDTPPV